MTYAELGACGEQVGSWLRAHGVSSDCVVALQLDRSLEQVVGIVGVLRSGGAYLPLDPVWPLARRRFMVEDASCGHLVAQSKHAAEYGGWFVGAVLELDDAWRVMAHGSREAVGWQPPTSQHLAYVIFTSGSTGVPKGVMVPHNGIVNLLAGSRSAISLRVRFATV